MAPNFIKIVGFSEILIFRRKILRLLLLVMIKVLNFIRKVLNLAPPTLQVATRLSPLAPCIREYNKKGNKCFAEMS